MATLKPDVSVIITSYNRLWALPKAVESCRNSNCRTEIIVVDDGSADGTWDWLQSQKDVVSVKTDNWGKCWAANTGFAAANGEFIRFLDSDDWLLAGANDRQLDIARATLADVVIAGHIYLDEEMGKTEEVSSTQSDDFLAQYIEMVSLGIDCHYSACLMRRSLIASIPHRQEFPCWHDIMFMLEVGLAKPNVAVCDSPSLVYRQHRRDRRLTQTTGIEQMYEVRRTIRMYSRILTLIRRRGDCTGRRQRAILSALWLEARKLARWNVAEAGALAKWINEQDHAFVPPVSEPVARLYRMLGFAITEILARTRRRFVRTAEVLRHRQ